MTDYRYVMGLLVEGLAYRQIEAMAGCSHRAIARARRVLDDEQLSSAEQVAALSAEDLDRFFADGRKNVAGEFVAVDIDSPTTTGSSAAGGGRITANTARAGTGGRDTSRAHLAGAKAFSLDALTTGDRRTNDGGDDTAAGARR